MDLEMDHFEKWSFASPAEIKVRTCSLMNGYFVGPKTCFDTSIPGVARWMDKRAPGERGEGSANWVVGGNLLEEE